MTSGSENKSSGIVNIRGKDYKTVALRVNEFRKDRPDWAILTDPVDISAESVMVKASILNEDGRIIGTGLAEESRTSSQINKTSALENCETSAIGRALAACGYAGTEYASANEVQNAISQQQAKDVIERSVVHMAAVRDNMESISVIVAALATEDLPTAAEAWCELSDEDKMALWVAPSKGGVFTTQERKILHSDEFAAIKRQFMEPGEDHGK